MPEPNERDWRDADKFIAGDNIHGRLAVKFTELRTEADARVQKAYAECLGIIKDNDHMKYYSWECFCRRVITRIQKAADKAKK